MAGSAISVAAISATYAGSHTDSGLRTLGRAATSLGIASAATAGVIALGLLVEHGLTASD